MHSQHETELMTASREGNVDTVSRLLTQYPTINLRIIDYYKWTPLHWAVWHNHLEVTKLLLREGIKRYGSEYIEQRTGHGWQNGEETALILAAKAYLFKMVFLLIDFDASLEAKDQNGKTAFYFLQRFDYNTAQLAMVIVHQKKSQQKTEALQSELDNFKSKYRETLLTLVSNVSEEKRQKNKQIDQILSELSQIKAKTAEEDKSIEQIKSKLKNLAQEDAKKKFIELKNEFETKMDSQSNQIRSVETGLGYLALGMGDIEAETEKDILGVKAKLLDQEKSIQKSGAQIEDNKKNIQSLESEFTLSQLLREADHYYSQAIKKHKLDQGERKKNLDNAIKIYEEAKIVQKKVSKNYEFVNSLLKTLQELNTLQEEKQDFKLNAAVEIHYICSVLSQHIYPVYDIQIEFSDAKNSRDSILKIWETDRGIGSILFLNTPEKSWEVFILNDAKKSESAKVIPEAFKQELKKVPNSIAALDYERKNLQNLLKTEAKNLFKDQVIYPRCLNISEIKFSKLPKVSCEVILPSSDKQLTFNIVSGGFKAGYLGQAYKIEGYTEKLIIIAHCGTVISENGDLAANGLFLMNLLHAQFAVASHFVKQVMDIIKKDFSSPVRILHTGHSLGAILAEVLAFENDDHFAVTFESPGSYELLEKMGKKHIFKAVDRIASYLAPPNFINTLKPHIGAYYQLLVPDVEADPKANKFEIQSLNTIIKIVELFLSAFSTLSAIQEKLKSFIVTVDKSKESSDFNLKLQLKKIYELYNNPLKAIISRDVRLHNMNHFVKIMEQAVDNPQVFLEKQRSRIIKWPIGPFQYLAFATFLIETELSKKSFDPDEISETKSGYTPRFFQYLSKNKSLHYQLEEPILHARL